MLHLPFLFLCCPNTRAHLMLDFADSEGLLHSPSSKMRDCSWSLHDLSVFTEVTHKESACELSRDLWSILYLYKICPCMADVASPWQDNLVCSCNLSISLSPPGGAWCSLLWLPLLHLTTRALQKADPGIGALNYGQVTKRRRGLEGSLKGSWSSFAITQIKINFIYVLSNSCLG